jgi:hypothetical protein
MQGMEEMLWGPSGPLRGQLGILYMFQVRGEGGKMLWGPSGPLRGQLGILYMFQVRREGGEMLWGVHIGGALLDINFIWFGYIARLLMYVCIHRTI